MSLEYQNTENLLQSQGKFYIKLGLERINALLALLGNPQNKVKIIHTAGTNGKGSVCSVLANILKSAGYKTGLYTSPHLKKYTERIKINNIDIDDSTFAKYVDEICALSDKNRIELTEFEILTACCYKYFADNRVDIAIIETGLGGRFDATNTSNNKLFSIITSISQDHTDRLGESIEKIAFEKAGIINENSTVIISSDNNGLNTIKACSQEKNSKVILAENETEIIFENGINYIISGSKKYEFALLGTYQKKNVSLILKAIEILNSKGFKIDEKALETGFKTVNWHARFEFIKEKNLVIDGAHNPSGARELKLGLDFYFKNKKRTFIYSTINTKNYVEIAKELFNDNDEIYFYEFNHKDAVPFEEYTKKVNWLKNIKKTDLEEVKRLLKTDELKVISGSLYMIGELYQTLS